MKKIISLLFWIIVGEILSVSSDDNLYCKNINNTIRLCKKLNILVSVEELYPSPHLFIIDKKISTIAPNAFKNLTIFHLSLEFADEKLNLEFDSFNGLRMLKSLEFRSGKIPMISNLFQALDTLNELTLIINPEDQSLIKATVDGLKNLIRLKITKSQLKIINDDNLKFYPAIPGLEFTDDNITTIQQDAFNSFKSLKHLRLSSNQLTYFNPETFDFEKLETLDLSQNHLTNITKNVFNKIQRQYDLNLSFNKINKIENGAFVDSKIRELVLDSNKLKYLESNIFNGLDELSLLTISSNKLNKISKNVFNELKNLTALNLVGNEINEIEPGAFEGLNLDCLELDNNNLTLIKADTFSGLNSRIISLSKNKNLKIENHAFRNATIMILFLENTNIVVDKNAWELSESTWVNV